MNTASCIILTFKEWTNWVTFGLLRNSQRIRAYTGTQKSFNDLLGITPDITHLEDNEFIVAKLRDSFIIRDVFGLIFIYGRKLSYKDTWYKQLY